MSKRLINLFGGRKTESAHATKKCEKADSKGKECDDLEEVSSFQQRYEKKASKKENGKGKGKEKRKQKEKEKKKGNGDGEKEKVQLTKEQEEELMMLRWEADLQNHRNIMAIFEGAWGTIL